MRKSTPQKNKRGRLKKIGIQREYFTLEQAADQLSCGSEDLLDFAMQGFLKLHTRVTGWRVAPFELFDPPEPGIPGGRQQVGRYEPYYGLVELDSALLQELSRNGECKMQSIPAGDEDGGDVLFVHEDEECVVKLQHVLVRQTDVEEFGNKYTPVENGAIELGSSERKHLLMTIAALAKLYAGAKARASFGDFDKPNKSQIAKTIVDTFGLNRKESDLGGLGEKSVSARISEGEKLLDNACEKLAGIESE